MTLNNYKIIDDGIWISKKEIEHMMEFYKKFAFAILPVEVDVAGAIDHAFYIGKADFCAGILKHFDNETTEDSKIENND